MFIIRNGEKIELTESETFQAAEESNLSYHILDIKSEYEEMYGEKFPYNEQVAEELANTAMHIVHNSDIYWDIYWEGFKTAIREYKESVDGKMCEVGA